MEREVRRWLVDISKWCPTPEEFSFLVFLLPSHEHLSITRFVKIEDRKRALVSRLLQYSLVHEMFDIPFDEIRICRTVEGKPFLDNETFRHDYPDFNFNASHCGDYVGIACEPLCVVGLDIVSLSITEHEDILEFIGNFKSYFTSLEWRSISSAGTLDDVLLEFYSTGAISITRNSVKHEFTKHIGVDAAYIRSQVQDRVIDLQYWCLKEACVKAIGAGLGYGLDRIEFRHHKWSSISVYIDGSEMKDWRFWLFDLDNKHCVSVARGPPSKAVDNYRKTLQKTHFRQEELCSGLHLSASSFSFRCIEQLIPASKREAYHLLCNRNLK